MLSIGDLINERYELLGFIANGGMGDVWKAKDVVLDRGVALKLVNSNYLREKPSLSKILIDEAKAGASLIGHPNIVSVLDFGEFNYGDYQNLYIVMELIEGPNLSEWIYLIKPTIDPQTYYYISLLIAFEICKAVNFAHRKDILHRDLKPLNIFLSPIGLTKVGDFGLSKFIDEATRTHTVWNANTPLYAAPEQWKGEKGTLQTDLYQLGITLFELFTGAIPFEKNTPTSLMYAHLNDEPRDPSEINDLISKDISDKIKKLLNKEPEHRGSLWELYDVIATEIQIPYNLVCSFNKLSEEEHKLIAKILEADINAVSNDPEFKIAFPDYGEVLSEGIELILNNITDFKIEKKIQASNKSESA